MDYLNANETIELTDLEPNGEVIGGAWTGALTLGADSTIGATQGRGAFVISTDKTGP